MILEFIKGVLSCSDRLNWNKVSSISLREFLNKFRIISNFPTGHLLKFEKITIHLSKLNKNMYFETEILTS